MTMLNHRTNCIACAAALTIALCSFMLDNGEAFHAGRPPRRAEWNSITTAITLYSSSTSSSSKKDDIEELLRRARQLRGEAEHDEHVLHHELLQKRSVRDGEMDAAILELFPPEQQIENNDPVACLVERLRVCRFSTSKLEGIVERLHARRMAARGHNGVTARFHGDQRVTFEHNQRRTVLKDAEPVDHAEAERMEAFIERLIEAAVVLDNEWLIEQERLQAANNDGRDQHHHHHHAEVVHWTKGETAKKLKEKVGFLSREFEDQFVERLEEFYEVVRREKRKSNKKK